MNSEILERLKNYCRDETAFEQLKQILAEELKHSQQEREKALTQAQYQLEQQKALARVITRIRESLDPEIIFQMTTREVCQLLQTDRVAVYRFNPDWSGEFIAEFVTPDWAKLVGPNIKRVWEDTFLRENQGGRYRNHETFAIDNIYQAGLDSCHIELLEQFDAKAYAIAPIMVGQKLWGLLAAYQNSGSRHWQATEIDLMAQIGDHFGVALQQAELLAEVRMESAERQQAEEQLRSSSERISLANAELARATRLKDEFLANMSHELRTPLNAILGLSEALQEEVYGALTDRQRRSLSTIEQSGRHLLELISDILDLAKIESGKMELELTPNNIHELCESSLVFVKQLAHQKNIKLSLRLPIGLGDIEVDQRRMRQVMINLLSNAVKFTPSGGEVWIEAEGDRQNEILQLSVVDTGIGIARENMDKLFKPFVQLDSSLSRRYSGTGLGLALVRRVVELHGGSVALESELGRGSRFTVKLCWKQPDSLAVIIPAAATEIKLPFLHQVLIVEDSHPTANQIARYLSELGAIATIHAQGEGAVEQALHADPDVIILDLLLPHLSGWDVLAQLKADPRTQHIPVLIISVVDEKAQALAMGASEYLVKPISRQQFYSALCKIAPKATQRNERTTFIIMPEPVQQPLVLLAEDNEANILTLMDYLEVHGYRVALARNGLEAVQMAKAHKPDLILMDIQMPEMDGLEATRQIRADQGIANIPIIALTSLAMPGDRDRCLAAGVEEYITKPVSLKQLVNVIAQYINPSE